MLLNLRANMTKSRRRQGSTSPPLVGVHPNPGPKKCGRRVPKPHSTSHLMTDEEKERIRELRATGMSGEEIAREIGRDGKAVRIWIKRNEVTHEMKRKERLCKKRQRETVNKENNKNQQKQKKQKTWKRLDENEQGYAGALLDFKISHRQIGKKMKRDQRTVDRLAEKRSTGKSKSPSSQGRPRKTTPRDDRALARRADAPDEPSTRTIAREISLEHPNSPISKDTVHRRLKEEGEVARRMLPKPRLTRKQMKARLEWAREHVEWTQEQWGRVLWSDESPFTVHPTPSRKFRWVRKGKVAKNPKARVNLKLIAPTVKFGGGKIQVWGCFYAGGVGHLKLIDGTEKKEDYKQILIHHMMPLIKEKALSEPSHIAWIFQQDGAKPHTANQNMNYLQRKAKESGYSWTVMDWPAQSADLSPIENLWHYLKNQLRKYPRLPTSKDDLYVRLKTEWEKLGPDALQPYVKSMRQRCEAVIEAGGGSITC